MTPPPIIILGAARSGTKFLRDCLSASEETATVMFDVNYIWRYGNEAAPNDALRPDSLTPERIAFITNTLRSMAKARPRDVLIEKTVSNTLRVPFVDRVFPDAVYIHLIRDGRDVTESAIRQWQAPPDWKSLWSKLRSLPLRNVGYAFWFFANLVKGRAQGRKGGKIWGPRFDGISQAAQIGPLAKVCALQWVASLEAAKSDLEAVPSARVHVIRYEDLVADEAAITALIDALSLSDGASVLRKWRSTVKAGNSGAWRNLPPADQETITQITGPTLAALGYLR